jgi:threonine 3-dehydrogenase
MVQSGLDMAPVITDRFPTSDYEEAFATAANGPSGKPDLRLEAT